MGLTLSCPRAMRSVSSMSDAEIRDELKFSRRWFDLGIVDDTCVALAVREYRESDDQGDEHYRYGAFVHFLRRRVALTPRQCRELFDLGADDSDRETGTSMMLDILRRPECPASFTNWRPPTPGPRSMRKR